MRLVTMRIRPWTAGLAVAVALAATAPGALAKAATEQTSVNAAATGRSTAPTLTQTLAALSDPLGVASSPAPAAAADAGQTAKAPKKADPPASKWHMGVTVYGDWAYYSKTGFGPQFLTQTNQEGPGNNGFNSFDINRAYLNFFFTPTKAITVRVTPNLYREVAPTSKQGFGTGAQIGNSANGNLGVRIKYAYIQFNTPFAKSQAFKKDIIRIGSTTIPLIDWEEGLWGYRFINLVPWNYLSLSSTYTGISLQGPIESHGKEYLDYQVGIYNTTSFHHIEQSADKEPMFRFTVYPMGTKKDRTGFGVTAFYDYAASSKSPDTAGKSYYRAAFIPFYQTPSKSFLIAAEYDLGRNAFSTGNLFSGVGPAGAPYDTFASLASALLSGTTKQKGFDVFGHVRLGHSPFTVLGFLQRFQPNTNVSGTNPIDLQRAIGGLSYKYDSHLEFALTVQNLSYYHSQFAMTPGQLASLSAALFAANPNGIANAVPTGTNAIMINVQFNY